MAKELDNKKMWESLYKYGAKYEHFEDAIPDALKDQGFEFNGTEIVPCENKPKFKEGDWVVGRLGLCHQIEKVIENVTNHTYGYDVVGGGYFNENSEGVRLWTIQDAKDGDVLASDNKNCPFIYRTKTVFGNPVAYCGVRSDGMFISESPEDHQWCLKTEVTPATKEQRDTLYAKMKEAGYEWDADKKELKKIEQKHAWSEKDEKMIENIIDTINMSIEDCDVDDIGTKARFTLEKERDWLKSLKDRYTWKPSDEQMQVLSNAGNSYRPFEEGHKVLWSLYNDLKKLREE